MRCRFALSPVLETIQAIRLTTPEDVPGHHRGFLHSVRHQLTALDLRPVTLLQPRRGYSPDFLSPPPTVPHPRFADELACIEATPLDRVREEVARSLRDSRGGDRTDVGRRLLADPADALRMLTGVIRDVWQEVIEPVWPRVRALLDADVAYQSRRMAEGGLDWLFAELHPQLRWHDGVLTRERGDDEHRDLTGNGLLLMPSAFKWDQVLVILDDPWQPTVIYPARGLATLWQSASAQELASLGRLVGRTRATLLAGLAEPATTSVLAHRHALAAGTVSEHLTVLRDSGLVVGERHRHEVRYRRTPLGIALVDQAV
ncbi:ArsR/SmtB family transcription factor [Micromonospora avicenniae]|uniref:ArsR/SmtB family transcription factor n=1 Tax=Micromonospora avicenniae TaxID=1198245 RepID=UPI0033206A5E